MYWVMNCVSSWFAAILIEFADVAFVVRVYHPYLRVVATVAPDISNREIREKVEMCWEAEGSPNQEENEYRT